MRSKYLRIISLSLMAAVLAVLIVGSLIGLLAGNDVAIRYVYTAPWTLVLYGLAVIMPGCYLIHERRRKHVSRWVVFIHLSMVLILCGALMTHIFGRAGRLTLQVGERAAAYEADITHAEEQMPFAIQLSSIDRSNTDTCSLPASASCRIGIIERTHRQDASGFSMKSIFRQQESPALPDFSLGEFVQESDLISAAGTIAPGKPYRYRGWMFAWGRSIGEESCMLYLSYDPLGYMLTWAGYAMLLLTLLLHWLIDRRHHSHSHHYHHDHPGSKIAEHMAAHDALKTLTMILLMGAGLLYSADTYAATASHSGENIFLNGCYVMPLAWLTLAFGIGFFAWYVAMRALAKPMPKWGGYMMALLLLVVWIILTVMLVGHSCCLGRVPLADRNEVMQVAAWMAMTMGLLLSVNSRSALPYGFLVAGGALVAAAFAEHNPIPFYPSSLSCIYVSCLMLGMVMYAFVMLNGISALVMPSREQHIMRHMSSKMLRIATNCMLLALLVRSLCSWVTYGSMWTWSQKEVWLLLVMVAYAVPIHRSAIPQFDKPIVYHIYVIVAFLTVAVAYFVPAFC